MLVRARALDPARAGVVAATFADELGGAASGASEPATGQVDAAIALAAHGPGSVIDL